MKIQSRLMKKLPPLLENEPKPQNPKNQEKDL
jgi:hypothetical protein